MDVYQTRKSGNTDKNLPLKAECVRKISLHRGPTFVSQFYQLRPRILAVRSALHKFFAAQIIEPAKGGAWTRVRQRGKSADRHAHHKVVCVEHQEHIPSRLTKHQWIKVFRASSAP